MDRSVIEAIMRRKKLSRKLPKMGWDRGGQEWSAGNPNEKDCTAFLCDKSNEEPGELIVTPAGTGTGKHADK